MLANGDPIKGLADFIADLVKDRSPLSGRRTNASVFVNNFPILTSLIVRAKQRSNQLAFSFWSSLHSLFSAIKLAFLYITTKLRLGKKLETQQEKAMLWRIKDTLGRATNHFSEAFKDKDHFNPIYFENDKFTEKDVDQRVDSWRETLTHG
jgi:hypothetical protein